MSVIDSFLNAMKINGSEDDIDDDGYDENDYLDEPVNEKPAKKVAAKETVTEEKRDKTSSKISPMRQSRRNTNPSGMELCVIKPVSIENGREITDTLLKNQAVVLNLEGLDVDLALRILDITYGACYALNGTIQKISNCIFIITPESVDITGDLQDSVSGTFGVPIQ